MGNLKREYEKKWVRKVWAFSAKDLAYSTATTNNVYH
ncbi:hypothetical protein ACSSV5_002476 [Psychroflexus sp. MBR-150]